MLNNKKSVFSHQQRMAYFFIAVPVVLLLVFVIIPIGMAIYFSFTDYNVINQPSWVGINNFRRMVNDPFLRIAISNTIRYTLLFVPLGVIVALSTALLLNMKKPGSKLFRTLFYLPVLSSSVATAAIWNWLLNPSNGLINQTLSLFGVDGPAWLHHSQWAMPVIVVMSVWMGFGGNMIIFLAGLQGIPEVLYEAARIEGANKWQTFRYVTLPALSYTMFLVTTLLIINSFQVFDQAFLLTQGGPGNSTITIVYYIYNMGFGSLQMGYASAVSLGLFIIIFLVSTLNMRINNINRD